MSYSFHSCFMFKLRTCIIPTTPIITVRSIFLNIQTVFINNHRSRVSCWNISYCIFKEVSFELHLYTFQIVLKSIIELFYSKNLQLIDFM
jgi:hypothetical protein